MLMPKRVKRRKVQRGRMTGKATRGTKLAYGAYGLAATEPCWITSNQLESGRIAINRSAESPRCDAYPPLNSENLSFFWERRRSI